MESTPIKALKIVSDAKLYIQEAMKSNSETFTYIKVPEQNKEYSEEQQKRILLYDVDEIAKQLSLLEKRKDKTDFLKKNVEKQDLSLVLTELILLGHYKEDSLGYIKPLDIFAFTPQCNSCGDCASIVYSNSPSEPYYNYRELIICHKCGHSENKTICDCENCSAKWNKFSQTLKNFKPYFDEGFSIIVEQGSIYEQGFKINDIDDVDSYLEMIARRDISPSSSFYIEDEGGNTIYRRIHINF